MAVVLPVDQPDVPVIGDGGGDDPHVHPAAGRQAEVVAQVVVDNQVGGGQPQIVPRPAGRLADEVQRRVPGIVCRPVGVGLEIPLRPRRRLLRQVAGEILPDMMGRDVPHLQKGHRQAAYRAAGQADADVLPVPQLGVDVDIFVPQVDPAAVPHLPVDDDDFLVVAVIHIQVGDETVGRAENRRLKALRLQKPVEVVRDPEKASHVVVQHPDLHPLAELFQQDLVDTVPQHAGRDDEIFDKYEGFRLFEILLQLGEVFLPAGEIPRVGAAVQRVAVLL